MPNTVRVTRRVKFLEISVYILLICFFIPIRINHHDIEEQFKDYLKQFNKTYNDHSIYKKKLAAFKVRKIFSLAFSFWYLNISGSETVLLNNKSIVDVVLYKKLLLYIILNTHNCTEYSV